MTAALMAKVSIGAEAERPAAGGAGPVRFGQCREARRGAGECREDPAHETRLYLAGPAASAAAWWAAVRRAAFFTRGGLAPAPAPPPPPPPPALAVVTRYPAAAAAAAGALAFLSPPPPPPPPPPHRRPLPPAVRSGARLGAAPARPPLSPPACPSAARRYQLAARRGAAGCDFGMLSFSVVRKWDADRLREARAGLRGAQQTVRCAAGRQLTQSGHSAAAIVPAGAASPFVT
ncbi:WASH complex subunit homolog 1-like [Schistocerca piceifrons]|uniref:WASH complex subunit homolog 1-like n=1 Tax=Schistocerca piceifrons TaxID=274613 RepID=UPI001F5E51C9|nr:WASH complex subunit homolog 1-like [Schistocerca piceifrons]